MATLFFRAFIKLLALEEGENMNIQKTNYNQNFQGLLNSSTMSRVGRPLLLEKPTTPEQDKEALNLFNKLIFAILEEKDANKQKLIKFVEKLSGAKFDDPKNAVITKIHNVIIVDGKDDSGMGTLLKLDTNA